MLVNKSITCNDHFIVMLRPYYNFLRGNEGYLFDNTTFLFWGILISKRVYNGLTMKDSYSGFLQKCWQRHLITGKEEVKAVWELDFFFGRPCILKYLDRDANCHQKSLLYLACWRRSFTNFAWLYYGKSILTCFLLGSEKVTKRKWLNEFLSWKHGLDRSIIGGRKKMLFIRTDQSNCCYILPVLSNSRIINMLFDKIAARRSNN